MSLKGAFVQKWLDILAILGSRKHQPQAKYAVFRKLLISASTRESGVYITYHVAN